MIEAAYNLLRVEKSASPEEVRNAYVRLVRRYPPEHFPGKFAELRDAYQKLTLCDDFLTAVVRRVKRSESSLELAAFLWGDWKELAYEPNLAPDEIASLLEGEDTRRDLDELLASISETEIEWKTGGSQ